MILHFDTNNGFGLLTFIGATWYSYAFTILITTRCGSKSAIKTSPRERQIPMQKCNSDKFKDTENKLPARFSGSFALTKPYFSKHIANPWGLLNAKSIALQSKIEFKQKNPSAFLCFLYQRNFFCFLKFLDTQYREKSNPLRSTLYSTTPTYIQIHSF